VVAQLGGGTGPAWSAAGLLWSAGALGGVVGTSLLAAPVLPRLGALAVTVYACVLAGLMLLAAAAVVAETGGPPILRTPTATQLAALAYLTIAVTAIVFIAWYGAMERLGVDRAGLFNGLIPVTSLAAVALTGTGTITPLRLLGALAVLAGVLLGLTRAGQAAVAGQLGTWPNPISFPSGSAYVVFRTPSPCVSCDDGSSPRPATPAASASRSSTMMVCMAWPACSGRCTTYTSRPSASSHTASVSCGKNDGGAPSSFSYQASAPAKSLTAIPANK